MRHLPAPNCVRDGFSYCLQCGGLKKLVPHTSYCLGCLPYVNGLGLGIWIGKDQKDKVRLACEWDHAIRAERHRASVMQDNFVVYRNLSEVVTAARAMQKKHDESWLDFETLGLGSDCEPIVVRKHKAEWERFYASIGITEKDLYTMVAMRTSHRWAHFNLP